MYATSYASGIWKSIDAGRTWNDLNGDDIAFAYVEGMLADKEISGKIYTHSFENGFHYSNDYGNNWIRGDISGNHNLWTSFLEKSGENIYILGRGGGSLARADSPEGVWESLRQHRYRGRGHVFAHGIQLPGERQGVEGHHPVGREPLPGTAHCH